MSWWEQLKARWYPGDPFEPTDVTRSYYESKYAVVARIAPDSICEIGVRAGYSAFTFLSAIPTAQYLGIDNGVCGPQYLDHARSLLSGSAVQLVQKDTQKLLELPTASFGRPFTFVHIDGDHSRAGCLHDIELAANSGAHYILVDDFDCPADDAGVAHVRSGCRDFLLSIKGKHWLASYVPNVLVGSLLLERSL